MYNILMLLLVIITLYFSSGMMNYMLGLLLIMIMTSCILFVINYNFMAIWLFMIYGGASTMLMLMVTSLVKYEIFETMPMKYYKMMMLEVILDMLLSNCAPLKMLLLHTHTFNFYPQFQEETPIWLISYHLYHFYGNFTIMVACVLFLILINIMHIHFTEVN